MEYLVDPGVSLVHIKFRLVMLNKVVLSSDSVVGSSC